MYCQDCDKRQATTIVYDKQKYGWFAVCDRCTNDEDLIVPTELIEKFVSDR